MVKSTTDKLLELILARQLQQQTTPQQAAGFTAAPPLQQGTNGPAGGWAPTMPQGGFMGAPMMLSLEGNLKDAEGLQAALALQAEKSGNYLDHLQNINWGSLITSGVTGVTGMVLNFVDRQEQTQAYKDFLKWSKRANDKTCDTQVALAEKEVDAIREQGRVITHISDNETDLTKDVAEIKSKENIKKTQIAASTGLLDNYFYGNTKFFG